jgi:hypothetical protein
MAAGAATLAAALLGFIFGVPFTRDGSVAFRGDDGEGTPNKEKSPGFNLSSPYRPNTSLEQISDWLSKMLVGVGLVEIKAIPGKLEILAAYVARGLGGGTQSETFALAVLVFFGVCGFLFGFLWARIYLRRWFTEADRDIVKKLDDKLSKIDADARALALVTQQLNRGPDEDPVSDAELAEAVKIASSPVKAQIFEQARVVSEAFGITDHDIKLQSVVAIMKALIACDTRSVYHRNHAELSYALSRQRPLDLPAAEKALSEAIKIRDARGNMGWKYYEFRRARYRIQQDASYKTGLASDPSSVETILTDLKPAFAQTDKWIRWIAGDNDVKKWIEINDVTQRLDNRH